jgi:hypothetical protein
MIKSSYIIASLILLGSSLGASAQTSGADKQPQNMETITRNVPVSKQPQTVGEKTIVSDNKELSRVRPHNDKEQALQQPAANTATKVERRKRE